MSFCCVDIFLSKPAGQANLCPKCIHRFSIHSRSRLSSRGRVADLGQREDPTLAYLFCFVLFFPKQEIAQLNIPFGLLEAGKKMLGRNIQLSPKVREDSSANAMVCELTAGFPPSLLFSCGGLLIRRGTKMIICNLGWSVHALGSQSA